MIGAVVDEVLEEMENATNEGMKAADDYMDAETGLLVCGNCHTKKQKKISFLGKERVVGCLCRCAAEKSQPYGLTTGSAGGLDEPLRGIFRYRL